jgi:hypothetical protein
MQVTVDGVTSATPLGLFKFQQEVTPLTDLMFGRIGGSLGETSGLLLLLGGVYLWLRRDLDWRIPVSILGTVIIFSACLGFFDAERFPVLGVLGRPYVGCDLHGNRPRDITRHAAGRLDIRHRHRRPGNADPCVWRPARGRHVRHPADERGHAADRPLHVEKKP